jgi:hypothetical protein
VTVAIDLTQYLDKLKQAQQLLDIADNPVFLAVRDQALATFEAFRLIHLPETDPSGDPWTPATIRAAASLQDQATHDEFQRVIDAAKNPGGGG